MEHDANPYTDLPEVCRLWQQAKSAPELAPSHHDSKEAIAVSDGGVDSKLELAGSLSVGQEEKIPQVTEEASDKVLGYNKRTVSKVFLLVIFVTIALVIGLGVGLTVGRAPSPTPSITVTPTSTTSAVATSGTTGMAEVKCPGINNTRIAIGSSTFEVRCSVHWPTNSPAADGNGTVQQVGSRTLHAYTLEQCLQHCVDYNAQNPGTDANQDGSGCLTVTYNANLDQAYVQKDWTQNCWLKDRVGVYDSANSWTESALLLPNNSDSPFRFGGQVVKRTSTAGY